MPSRHLACAAFNLSFSMKSRNAWQSVSISTGNPHMTFENLSSENFSAANSNRKGLYFSSVCDVRFDANAMGCNLLTVHPLGSVVLKHCASTPAKPSLHPSVVTTNGDPSHLGPLSIGSVVIAALRCMNTLSCTSFQVGSSLWAAIILR